MPTQETEHRSLGAAVKEVTEHASSWFRLERELAVLELKHKVTSLGVGLALAVGAAIFALYAVGFAFATVAAALATFLPTWLALLIVTLVLFAVVGLLGLIGVSKIKRGTPPVPEQAIEEAKRTTIALKSNGR
jgi:amino acid transporter